MNSIVIVYKIAMLRIGENSKSSTHAFVVVTLGVTVDRVRSCGWYASPYLLV